MRNLILKLPSLHIKVNAIKAPPRGGGRRSAVHARSIGQRTQIVAVYGFRQRWRLPRRPSVDHLQLIIRPQVGPFAARAEAQGGNTSPDNKLPDSTSDIVSATPPAARSFGRGHQ